MPNKLAVGNNSQKRSISHSVVELNEDTLRHYPDISVAYTVLDLPESILITNAYVLVVEASDAGSIQVSTTPDGTTNEVALLALPQVLTAVENASASATVPTFYEHGTYINIEFSVAAPTTGKSYVVIEYIEVEKYSGELTQVPVSENLI